MKIAIRHDTRYVYDAPVRSSTQYLRLVPRDTARQKVIAWKLDTPVPTVRTQDGYGNVLDVLTLDKPVAEIRIVASGTVETLCPRKTQVRAFRRSNRRHPQNALLLQSIRMLRTSQRKLTGQ